MVTLTQALLSRLDGDAELTVTRNTQVRYHRNPDNPKALLQPLLVVKLGSVDDKVDRHGAAQVYTIEFTAWGYDANAGADVSKITETIQRVDELMVRQPFGLSDGGVTTRPLCTIGWQAVEGPDPLVVQMRAEYSMTLYSKSREDAVS